MLGILENLKIITTKSHVPVLCVLISLISSTSVSAKSTSSTKASSSSSSSSYKSESSAKLLTEEDNKLSASFSTYLSRGLDEDKDFNSLLRLSADYEAYDDYSFGIVMDYTHQFTKYEDKDRNTNLGDTEVSFGTSSLLDTEAHGFGAYAYIEMLLPTSQTSRDSGLIFSNSLDLGLSKKIDDFRITLANEFFIYNHQFKTADKAGEIYNEKYATWTKLTLSQSFKNVLKLPKDQDLKLVVLPTIYSSVNHAGTRVNTNHWITDIVYKLNNDWTASGRFQSRNRFISNNNLFDDDNTSVRLGITRRL